MKVQQRASLRIEEGTALVLACLLMLSGMPHVANGQASKKLSVAGLQGAWSEGGTVSFTSGAREQARCRARFSRSGKDSYTVNATCATASGRAAQTARVSQVGNNRYSGSFYNSERHRRARVEPNCTTGQRQRVQSLKSEWIGNRA
jgi:hypothetical protein